MAKVGFDVAQFLSPYGGDPMGGQKLYQRALEQGGEAQRQIFQDAMQQRMEQQRMEQQQAALRAQLAERLASREALVASRGDAATRANARLDLDRKKFELEARKDLGAQDAAALQSLVDPYVAGNPNALTAAAARVSAQDPTLQVRLPTDLAASTAVRPAGIDGGFSADQAFSDDPLGRLVVQRGERKLYDADQGQVRANELGILGRTLDPLMASPFAGAYAPAVEAGKQLAGAGMSGPDAAKFAVDQANKEANRGVQQQMAGARLGETVAQHNSVDQFKLHNAIEGVATRVASLQKVPDIVKDTALIGEIKMQLESGAPMAENQALKGLLMRYTGKAMSNAEAIQAESSAGQWTRLEKLARQWTAGGALPADFKDQMASGLAAIDRYNRIRLHKAGVAARDAMYSSTELPMDLDQTVRAGNQVYTKITGHSLSPEELAAEKQRLMRLRGGQAPVAPAQGRPDMGGSGATDNLGTAPVPRVAPAPAPEDREVQDLDRALEELLNGP
jgi:hypothetical protein